MEFQSGVLEREVEVEITDDDITELEEVITLYLSSGTDVYLHPHAQAHVKIVDNDGKQLVKMRIVHLIKKK